MNVDPHSNEYELYVKGTIYISDLVIASMIVILNKWLDNINAANAPIKMYVPKVQPMNGSKSMVRLQRDRQIDSK